MQAMSSMHKTLLVTNTESGDGSCREADYVLLCRCTRSRRRSCRSAAWRTRLPAGSPRETCEAARQQSAVHMRVPSVMYGSVTVLQ